MKVSTVIAFLFMMSLSGCASYMRHVKALPESDSGNNITMLRNYNYVGAAVRYWPTVDGQEISGIFPTEHISFILGPGKHYLGVRCGWSEDQVEINVKDNEPRYFKLSPDLWSFLGAGCAEIQEISKTEATDRLGKSMRIKTGYMSDCDRKSVLYESKPDYTCFSYAFP